MATLEDTAATSTELVKTQNLLLDYTGHVRPMSGSRQRCLVAAIQQLRTQLGWPALDMSGRQP